MCRPLKIIKFYLQTCWSVHTMKSQWLCEYLSISFSRLPRLVYLQCKFMAKYHRCSLLKIATECRGVKFFMLHFFMSERKINSIICFFGGFKIISCHKTTTISSAVDDSFFSCGHLTLIPLVDIFECTKCINFCGKLYKLLIV